MDIQYLDGDSRPSRASQAPKYQEPPPPPPNARAPKWYRCDNPNCGQYGRVATVGGDAALCPQCKHEMLFLIQGPMPAGHQRMELPDYGSDNAGSGRVSIS